jgi:cytochrome oxidase Cu insertion factor (SCO1/SenC/PrrC family)
MPYARWKTMIFAAGLAGSLLAGGTLFGGARPAQENAKVNHTSLKAGDMAPDFTLLDNQWKQIHLSDYRGKKNVVLAFYVLAFTEG